MVFTSIVPYRSPGSDRNIYHTVIEINEDRVRTQVSRSKYGVVKDLVQTLHINCVNQGICVT